MGDKPFLGMVLPVVPAVGWIRAYEAKKFRRDLVAGLSLAAFVIPESLAYASLAQLPPVTGLYCYLVAGIAYAVFGTSRQLAVGPTSALAITVATSVVVMAGGDPSRALALASVLALIVGAVCIAGRFIGLANVAYFISDAILIGFKTGAAIYIASTQLPKLFGIEGITGNVFERFGHVVMSLHETHVFSLVVGLAAIALFLTFGRFFPGRPTTLFVVVAAIAMMGVFGLADTGIKIVGDIPAGLPAISVPAVHLSDISALVPIALACVLLAYGETISVARSFAQKHGYDISPEQELTALGAANVATGLAHGFPVAGGMSQTAVNDMGGASSPFSLLVTSGAIALTLVFFAKFFHNLPEPGVGGRRADGGLAHGATGRPPPIAFFIARRVSHFADRTVRRPVLWVAQRPAAGRGRIADHGHCVRIAPTRGDPRARSGRGVFREPGEIPGSHRNTGGARDTQRGRVVLLQCGPYPPPNLRAVEPGNLGDQNGCHRFLTRARRRRHRGRSVARAGAIPQGARHRDRACRAARRRSRKPDGCWGRTGSWSNSRSPHDRGLPAPWSWAADTDEELR